MCVCIVGIVRAARHWQSQGRAGGSGAVLVNALHPEIQSAAADARSDFTCRGVRDVCVCGQGGGEVDVAGRAGRVITASAGVPRPFIPYSAGLLIGRAARSRRANSPGFGWASGGGRV